MPISSLCMRYILTIVPVLVTLLFPGWAQAGTVETALMPGQVIEGHAKWEEDCTLCHKRFDKAAQTTLCLDCHKDVRNDVNQQQGFHGRFKKEQGCRECHTEHKGRAEDIAPINERTFDHSQTDFILRDSHADAKKVECKACHKPKIKYRDTPSDCYGCHQKDDKHNDRAGKSCADCHTEQIWKKIRFDHNKTTYPLKGKHAEVSCKSCHTGDRYKNTPTECYACHKKDDKHNGQEGTKCETCHQDRTWKDAPFNHHKSRFPLLGKHVQVKCKACHLTPAFKDAPMDCYGCHRKDDTHKGAVGQVCADCHSEQNWKEVRFNHDKTRYKLRHKHADVPCKDCHQNNRYKDTPMECYACHKKDDKHNGQEGTKCETCHQDRTWKDAPFDHHKSRFPLLGKHAQVKCKACHLTPAFKDAPTDCYGCHRKDDTHKGTYGERCEACHGADDWKTLTFDHDLQTHYPLRGKHLTTTCALCHQGYLYKDKTPTDCYACHRKDDTHKGQFNEQCAGCHTERDWKTLLFDHRRDTRYPLNGYHRKTKCEACHTGVLYKDKTPTGCYACHRKDDKHTGRFSQACERCHAEQDWKTLLFEHDRDTTYPLLGKHRATKCHSCHKGSLYKDKTPIDCYSCHQSQDTHHRRLGTRCEDCHNARDWKIWDFNHDTRTRFTLDGRHKGVGCHECHTAPMDKHVVLSATCLSCHAKDDRHGNGFGPRCERCHETTDWRTLKPGSGGLRRR